MKENSKRAAYPTKWDAISDEVGITKREYFAAMALRGLSSRDLSSSEIARYAVRIADDTLKLLKETDY